MSIPPRISRSSNNWSNQASLNAETGNLGPLIHSGLEVDTRYEGKEVDNTGHDAKQVYVDNGIQLAPDSTAEVVVTEKPEDEYKYPRAKRRICGLSATVFWIIAAFLLIAIIAGVLAGALMSTVGKKKTSSPSSPGNPSLPAAGNSSTPANNSSSPQGSQSYSSVAAVSFTHIPAPQVENWMVFSQDNVTGLLMLSFWSGSEWGVTVLNDATQLNPKAGTPISAGAYWDDLGMDVHVHYLTEGNILNNFMFGNLSLAFEWDLGANAEKNQAAANSSLAEVWHRCADCGVNTVSGLVTIWQKPNGEVWVRNGTSTGPVYYQMPVEAQMGSPFEIIMLHSSQERSQLYFFYTQAAANGMSEVFAANWVPSDPPSAGWTNSSTTITTIPAFSPMTAYSTGSMADAHSTLNLVTSSPNGSLTQNAFSIQKGLWTSAAPASVGLTTTAAISASDDGMLFTIAEPSTTNLQEWFWGMALTWVLTGAVPNSKKSSK